MLPDWQWIMFDTLMVGVALGEVVVVLGPQEGGSRLLGVVRLARLVRIVRVPRGRKFAPIVFPGAHPRIPEPPLGHMAFTRGGSRPPSCTPHFCCRPFGFLTN